MAHVAEDVCAVQALVTFLWSFIAKDEAEREMIAYVLSPGRSSETAVVSLV